MHVELCGLVLLLFLCITEVATKFPFVTVKENQLKYSTFDVSDRYKSMTLHNGLLYVGGKERIHVRKSDNISSGLVEMAWSASQSLKDKCTELPERIGGPGGEWCFNFIRNLQPFNDSHMLVCGTQAIRPQNALISTSDWNITTDHLFATGLCSQNPTVSVTTQRVSKGGAFSGFVGTSGNFEDSPKIVKIISENKFLQTSAGSTENMLNSEVKFVSSFTANDIMERHTMKKVYVVFNEKSPQLSSRPIGTRIAQICANDIGGGGLLPEDSFTSFLKVTLVCQVGGDNPLPFSEATDITYTAGGTIYGTFYSKNVQFESSAVCAFNIEDVQKALHSNSFVVSEPSLRKAPDSKIPSTPPGICAYPGMNGVNDATSKDFSNDFTRFMTDHPFVSGSVMSSTLDTSSGRGGTLLYNQGVKFVKIAVHKQRALDGSQYDIIYVATLNGAIIKFYRTQDAKPASRLLAKIQLFRTPINNLLISSSSRQLYADTDGKIRQISLANCDSYTCPDCDPCRMCVLSRDPMCGWDPNAKKCLDINDHPSQGSLIQSVVQARAESCGELTNVTSTTKKVDIGSSVILGNAIDLQTYDVTWYKVNSMDNTDDQTLTATSDGRLEFTSFGENDLGTYKCVIKIEATVVSTKQYNCVKKIVDGSTIPPNTKSIIASNPPPTTKNTGHVIAGNSTDAVPPTAAPDVGQASTVVIVIVVLIIAVVAALLVFVLYRMGYCFNRHKHRMEEKAESPSKNGDREMQLQENNSNNAELLKNDKLVLDTTDSGNSNNTPTTKKVAAVPPMNFGGKPKPEDIRYIDEDIKPSEPLLRDSSKRKPPKRTKSIPAKAVMVAIDGDYHKCDSIRRHPKRGTWVFELALRDDVDIVGDGVDASIITDTSFMGNDTEATPLYSFNPTSDRPDQPANGGTIAFGADSDSCDSSTLKANSEVTSSAASTPRTITFTPPQPQLSSSYNRRLRGSPPPSSNPSSPRVNFVQPSSPLSSNAANLRRAPARNDKSPTSTASSSSTSSAHYVTPPRSPVKVA